MFFLFSGLASAETISVKEIKELRRVTTHKCYKKQRKLLTNSLMSDTQLGDYCSCIAEEFFPMNLSLEILLNTQKAIMSGNNEKALRIMLDHRGLEMEDIEEYCARVALRQ